MPVCKHEEETDSSTGAKIPNFPFKTIAIDTCGPFPTSANGNVYVLTVVDMFTGYIECRCTPTKAAHEVARFLIDEIIPRHSCPLNLISDRGTEFNNKVIEHLTNVLRVCHIKTTPYNPSANGRCERIHRVLTECLTKLIMKDENNWDQYVKMFVGAYNCADHSNTGHSPFFLLYNRQPMYPMDTLLQDREKYYGEEMGPQMIERMHKIFKIVKRNIANQSTENRDRRNKDLKPEPIKVGDMVYVYNQKRANKLHPKWLKGYTVVKKTGEFSFEVVDQLTQRTLKVHNRNLRKAYPNDVWNQAQKVKPGGRPKRHARLVMTPSGSSNEHSSSSSESDIDDEELRTRWLSLRGKPGSDDNDNVNDDMDLEQMRDRLCRLRDVEGNDKRGQQPQKLTTRRDAETNQYRLRQGQGRQSNPEPSMSFN